MCYSSVWRCLVVIVLAIDSSQPVSYVRRHACVCDVFFSLLKYQCYIINTRKFVGSDYFLLRIASTPLYAVSFHSFYCLIAIVALNLVGCWYTHKENCQIGKIIHRFIVVVVVVRWEAVAFCFGQGGEPETKVKNKLVEWEQKKRNLGLHVNIKRYPKEISA